MIICGINPLCEMYGHFWVGITDKKYYAHACTHNTQTYLWIQKQARTSVKTHSWHARLTCLISSLMSQTQLIIFSLWIHFSLNLPTVLSRSLCVCLHVWMSVCVCVCVCMWVFSLTASVSSYVLQFYVQREHGNDHTSVSLTNITLTSSCLTKGLIYKLFSIAC